MSNLQAIHGPQENYSPKHEKAQCIISGTESNGLGYIFTEGKENPEGPYGGTR
jgi:hypothetical protein